MTRVRLPYYVIRRGRGFWQPTPRMIRAGAAPRACGHDGPEARAFAFQCYSSARCAGRRKEVSSPKDAGGEFLPNQGDGRAQVTPSPPRTARPRGVMILLKRAVRVLGRRQNQYPIEAGALRLFERTHDGTLEMVRAEWKCLDEQERAARKLDWLASWRAALDAKE